MANPNAASERPSRPPCWFDAELRRNRHAAIAASRRDPTSTEARQRRRDYQRLLQRKQRDFKHAQAAALVQAASTMSKDFWRRFKPKQQIEPSISKNQWFSHFSTPLGEAPSEGSSDPGDAHAPRAADGSELNQPFTAAEIVGGASMLRRSSATLGFLSVEALRAAASLLALCSFMGQDPKTLAAFAFACYKKDKELKSCNLPVRATRRTRT